MTIAQMVFVWFLLPMVLRIHREPVFNRARSRWSSR